MKFGNFLGRSLTVLLAAQKEAQKNNTKEINSLHILSGIIIEGGFASKVVGKKNITIETVRKEYGEEKNDETINAEDLLMSLEMKKIIDAAITNSRVSGRTNFEPEDLLIGIMYDKCKASDLLEDNGFSFTFLKKEYEKEMKRRESEKSKNMKKKEEVKSGKTVSQRGNNRKSMLEQYGTDLCELARNGGIDPVIGRENDIRNISEILCRRKKSNPIILGPAGSGKTSVVEGLALLMINEEKCPEYLKDKRLVTLDIGAMVAGAKYRGR